MDVIFKSEGKVEEISQNEYMKNSLDRLKTIQGDLFLYGVALSAQDQHIWNAIKKNDQIENIYISVFLDENKESDLTEEKARTAFGNKKFEFYYSKSI